jgi:hypothetical protein
MTDAVAVAVTVARTLLLLGLLVLPGFVFAARLAAPIDRGSVPLLLAIASSVLVLLAAAVPLLIVGWFSPGAIGLVALLLAVAGARPFGRWVRSTLGGPGVLAPLAFAAWAVVLALPWLLLALRDGYPPADKLQWYYAEVAGQLGAAGGIPQGVAEWGALVRWLPDYLAFDVVSQAYTGVLPGVPVADAISAWRIPVAGLSLVLAFLALRLWVGRVPAMLGAVLIGGSTFFIAKFNAYKPESLGILLGLGGLLLVVHGIRSRRRSWLLVAGALFGANLSVHAIAALAMGLLTAGFALAEWGTARRDRAAIADGLVRAALVGIVLSVALGAGLQGRAAVASQALTPAVIDGHDPTWTFFLRSTGNFADPEPAAPKAPLAAGVVSPWDGFRVTSAFGWWLPATVAIGLFFLAAFGGRRGFAAAVGLAASAALLGAAVLFFALAFTTYVPRWTGLVRLGQYAPLFAGIGVAFAVEGFLRTWSRLAERRLPRALPAVASVIAVAWLLPWSGARDADELAITPNGRGALEELTPMARPGVVVVTNVLTTGTVESFTGLEDPLEGRQPLIEERAILARANDLLLAAHRWFESPADRAFVDSVGARWVLVVGDPAMLGAAGTLGGSVAGFEAAPPWLRGVAEGPGVAIYEVIDPATAAAAIDRLRPLPPAAPALLWAAVLALVLVAVVRLPALQGDPRAAATAARSTSPLNVGDRIATGEGQGGWS